MSVKHLAVPFEAILQSLFVVVVQPAHPDALEVVPFHFVTSGYIHRSIIS
jgi:hypothetical protein